MDSIRCPVHGTLCEDLGRTVGGATFMQCPEDECDFGYPAAACPFCGRALSVQRPQPFSGPWSAIHFRCSIHGEWRWTRGTAFVTHKVSTWEYGVQAPHTRREPGAKP